MRLWCSLAVMAFALTVSGCATPDEAPLSTDPQCHLAVAGPRVDLASTLLFDRKPGPFVASDFAYRSDWPSTVSYYSPSQVIYFRERFVDIQGRGFGGSDSTYRRFETHRVGVGYR